MCEQEEGADHKRGQPLYNYQMVYLLFSFYAKILLKEWNQFLFRNLTFDNFTFAVYEDVLRDVFYMI